MEFTEKNKSSYKFGTTGIGENLYKVDFIEPMAETLPAVETETSRLRGALNIKTFKSLNI